ncbi:MAG TPA: transporter [Rariglobus sp.]|nr:transporter [Rariglobus sp.]
MRLSLRAASAGVAMGLGGATASTVLADYSLFNPVPAGQLRPLNTDRPDLTESPFTVDAGHFQIETDVANYTHGRDKSGGGNTRTNMWSFGTVNLKAGLTPNTDVQWVIGTYNQVRTKDRVAGTAMRQDGFGDMTVRVKHNFWGNDGGTTAFGVMPFVKFPTSQDGVGNQSVEGGVIFPLAVSLPGGWDLGAMTEVDCVHNDRGSGSHAAFVNTITVGHGIVGELSGYVEFYSEISAERGTDWVGLLDFGLTYGIGENTQLDAGVNIGVTGAAPDWNPFVGVSRRF